MSKIRATMQTIQTSMKRLQNNVHLSPVLLTGLLSAFFIVLLSAFVSVSSPSQTTSVTGECKQMNQCKEKII